MYKKSTVDGIVCKNLPFILVNEKERQKYCLCLLQDRQLLLAEIAL